MTTCESICDKYFVDTPSQELMHKNAIRALSMKTARKKMLKNDIKVFYSRGK